MGDFVQTLIIATTIGSLYALIALGYTMVYGILKLINFAHSDVVVLGAWVSYTLATFLLPRIGVPLDAGPWYVGVSILLLSMLICGLVGFAIERLAYKPIRRAPRLNALITAIGVSLFLQNAGQLQYTLVPPERIIAAGKVVDRGAVPTSIKLDQPVSISSGSTYQLQIQPADATTPTSRIVTATVGQYAPGAELSLDQPIGRAMTRDATYKLTSPTLSALKLPWGAMPAGMPTLLPTATIWKHDFSTPFQNSDGTITMIPKPVIVSWVDLLIVITAVVLMAGLELLIFHTRLGMAMRAVSFNFETAGLMGVPVDRIISITFVTGAMLAAAAGFLYAVKYQQIQQPAHQTWVLLGLKAFVAAVVGGIGNVRGAAVGGFLIAFIEQFSGVYLQRFLHWDNAAAFTDVYVFALLIAVLLIKPAGLFGSTAREKV